MEGIEITAATVEEAIEKAEAQLGLSRDQFEMEVIREEKSGILGAKRRGGFNQGDSSNPDGKGRGQGGHRNFRYFA